MNVGVNEKYTPTFPLTFVEPLYCGRFGFGVGVGVGVGVSVGPGVRYASDPSSP